MRTNQGIPVRILDPCVLARPCGQIVVGLAVPSVLDVVAIRIQNLEGDEHSGSCALKGDVLLSRHVVGVEIYGIVVFLMVLFRWIAMLSEDRSEIEKEI